jgi:hypothetical protein
MGGDGLDASVFLRVPPRFLGLPLGQRGAMTLLGFAARRRVLTPMLLGLPGFLSEETNAYRSDQQSNEECRGARSRKAAED